MLTKHLHRQGLKRLISHKRVDPMLEQVRKVLEAADQRLILMVRG